MGTVRDELLAVIVVVGAVVAGWMAGTAEAIDDACPPVDLRVRHQFRLVPE
jgi:hypothetical protein